MYIDIVYHNTLSGAIFSLSFAQSGNTRAPLELISLLEETMERADPPTILPALLEIIALDLVDP